MWEEILKAIPVYFSTMIKFIFGPIGGKAAGLNMFTTMIATAAGMMTVVIAITYFGKFIQERILKRFQRKEKEEYAKPRKPMAFLKKYGLGGIAFLTPILLTPIGGTLLAIGLGGNRQKIIVYMLISACAWSAILTFAVYFGYNAVMELIEKMQPV